MAFLNKIKKIFVFASRNIISLVSARAATQFMTRYYQCNGMKILGQPNFIAATTWFDGTDYSMIELNEGCTISSYVRILTHDWSLYTIGRGMGLKMEKPVGIFRPVRIGRYAFIGAGSILLPGADVGDGVLVGAGSVVRGKIPPWTIVVGSPAEPVGDSREFVKKNLRRMGFEMVLSDLEKMQGQSSGRLEKDDGNA